ncbi:MAG: hypothetical protein ACI9D5_000065 [Candidatus Endobugula sp.]|jgi:hypothetical protein
MLLSNYFIIILSVFFSVTTYASINDPTKPIYSENETSSIVTNKVVKESKIVLLQSIFFSSKHKVAILNGTQYKEGDVIDSVTMESIHKDHVFIKFKQSTTRLSVSKKLYLDSITGESSE